jgi:hypothetical protein
MQLGFWGTDVSALPGVLPHSSKSPASYQSPCIMEVRRSVAVFQWPSWISSTFSLPYSLVTIFRPNQSNQLAMQ